MAALARTCFKVDSDESFRRSPRVRTGFRDRATYVERPVDAPSPQDGPTHGYDARAGNSWRTLFALAIGMAIMAFAGTWRSPLSTAVAQWLASHADQKQAADDLDGTARSGSALAWSDKSPAIFALRGQVRLEKGRLEGGLADFNKSSAW